MMNSDTNEISFNNKKTARYLLFVAFAVEICVALLAVFFGYSLTYSGTQNLVGNTEGIIIPLGLITSFFLFLLIAVVELTRVPLVLSIYRGESTLWKFIGGTLLAIIMFLAIETLFFAQVQMNTLRLLNVTDKDLQIELNTNNIKILNEEINSIDLKTKDDIASNYELRINETQIEQDRQINPLLKKIERIETERDKINEKDNLLLNNLIQEKDDLSDFLNNSDNFIKKNILEDRERLNTQKFDERNLLQEEKQLEIKSAEDLYQTEQKNIKDNKIQANNTLSDLNQNMLGTSKEGGFLQKSKEIGDKQSLLKQIDDTNKLLETYELREIEASETYKSTMEVINSKYEIKFAEFDTKYDDLFNKSELDIKNRLIDDSALKTERQDLVNDKISLLEINLKDEEMKANQKYNPEIDLINDEIANINSIFKDLREEEKSDYDNNLENLKDQEKLIEDKKKKIDEHRILINEAKESKGQIVSNNILYKVATQFSFIEACKDANIEINVTPECRKRVQIIWFGSIALVISIAGSAIAFASEVVRTADVRHQKNQTKKNQKPLRTLLVKILRYTMKPKIRKVPVDKIVEVEKLVPQEKLVYKEVPKEVTRKEVLHVPVPTLREDLVAKKATKTDTKKTLSPAKKPINKDE